MLQNIKIGKENNGRGVKFEDKKGKHTREKGSVIWGRRERGGGEERERGRRRD